MNRKILVNKWKSPDRTILHSRHRHDFVIYTDDNCTTYFVDGGMDYCRINSNDLEFIGCYQDDLIEIIREVFDWGSYGIDGKQEKHYILLKDLTDEHLDNILRTQSHIKDTITEKVLKMEKEYRRTIKKD